jgi:hypothetical protein
MWINEHKNVFFNKFKREADEFECKVGQLLVEQKGGNWNLSKARDDMKKHVDLWWTDKDGVIHGIDVKMPKKTRRTDSEPDNERTWVEILNVGGKPGWIDGEEEFIAFVRSGEYQDVLFVDRAKLSKFVKTKIKKSKTNEYNSGVSYDLYTRKKWGNNDLCTIVPFEDMKPFVVFSLKFEKL